MEIRGLSNIAGQDVAGSGAGTLRAVNPATMEPLEPAFTFLDLVEVDRAVEVATAAFDAYRAAEPEVKARFLETIADRLDTIREDLVERARAETGLTRERLLGEHARTANQLRHFAGEVRLGEHQGVRISSARGPETGRPGPDMRLRQIPLGPVVVLGASNFPLAFSTAGGDTASALAAGCPVIVKAHNAHPGTAELAGRAIVSAAHDCGLPAGVFSLLFGSGTEIGQRLTAHPGVAAVAFTGSKAGGTALMATAAARPVPIPVFAEMASSNPTIVLPGAADDLTLAVGFLGSLTLGSGQFCTNPGLLFLPHGSNALVAELAERVRSSAGQTMLSPGICAAYQRGVAQIASLGVDLLAEGRAGDTENSPAPALFLTTAEELRKHPILGEEVFGAVALVVTYRDRADLCSTLELLGGQLTATLRMTDGDLSDARALLPLLERKAGRIVVNGWPTGLDVNDATVHGGPFPATSNGQTTSVGSLAIQRFQRPVCYQDLPEQLMPSALRNENPWQLPRRLDGRLER